MKRIILVGAVTGFMAMLCIGESIPVKYVSSDGGFTAEEKPKRGLSAIEYAFERYRFLRNDSDLTLYRTTTLNPFNPFNLSRWRCSYNDSTRATPIDLYAELRKKAVEEYLPSLPSPLTIDGVRFFYYNQYDRDEVYIYGIYCEMVFGLIIRNDPSISACACSWDSPVWHWGVDVQDPNWKRVWIIVKNNRQYLIQYWDAHYDEIIKRFDSRYDGLF